MSEELKIALDRLMHALCKYVSPFDTDLVVAISDVRLALKKKESES